MHSKNTTKLAYEVDASRESFEKVVEIMWREVPIPTSNRYNATFDEKDLHRSLIHLAVSNGYAESGMEGLVAKWEPLIPSGKFPSGSWIRDTVGKVPENVMVEKLKNALDSTVKQLSTNFKLFSAPIIGGADTHKIRRYDKNLDHGFLTRGKHERGTSTFEEYMTLQSVEEGKRVQIACEHIGIFDEKYVALEKLILESRLLGIDIALELVDRGFFNSKTIKMFKRIRQTYLMPATKNTGIKKAIMEFIEGKRERISEYTMNEGKEDLSCTFTLVILPKAGKCEGGNDPTSKYIVFATNIPREHILSNISRLPKDYRLRWGLESGYIDVEDLRAKTTSKNHTLRLLYFYYALILYNAWLLSNLNLARKFNVVPFPPSEPIIHLQLMKDAFERFVIESILIEMYGTCQIRPCSQEVTEAQSQLVTIP
jgi:hypothetical protein